MKQYVVDAFTDQVFAGNPAAVCVMDGWLNDEVMRSIAIENNLSETAFAVSEGEGYRLRWFTPGGEVELCGHATLASAYVIMRFYEPDRRSVSFDTLSGKLTVEKQGDLLRMDFPSFALTPVPVTDEMASALGVRPKEAYFGADLVCILENEGQVREVRPDQELVRQLDGLCLHISAPGTGHDCVTRTFAPKCNVAEDPVCGRGHCHVIPYWAQKLGRNSFVAYQASARGGVLYCEYAGERTILSGKAALFSQAELYVE